MTGYKTLDLKYETYGFSTLLVINRANKPSLSNKRNEVNIYLKEMSKKIIFGHWSLEKDHSKSSES